MDIINRFKQTVSLNLLSLSGYIIWIITIFCFKTIQLPFSIFLGIAIQIGLIYFILILLSAITEITSHKSPDKLIIIKLNDKIFYIGIFLFILFIIWGIFFNGYN